MVKIRDKRVSIQLFADEMVLLEEGKEELNGLMTGASEYCTEQHLGVNDQSVKGWAEEGQVMVWTDRVGMCREIPVSWNLVHIRW